MKYINTLCTILLMSITSQSYAQNIVDYYKLLSGHDHDIEMYALTEKEGKWVCTNADGVELPVTVDLKNQYIEITEDHKEHGVFTMQLAMYTKKSGEDVVGVAKNMENDFVHGEVHFLKYRNGKWDDVTERVMPQITYKDFSEQQDAMGMVAAAPFDEDFNHEFEFGYTLPRSGNSAQANIETAVLKNKCKEGNQSIDAYCKDLSNVKYSAVDLKWDRVKGIFKIVGKK
ncbi:MAG: hypothetical protein GY810_28685 [Aureispira sp.]|nr:hypothetical protein [Aureispira sp.]